MKILIVTKRRTSGYDVVADRFGRYYHLGVALVALGHEVVVVTAGRDRSRDDTHVDGVRFVTRPLTIWTVAHFLRAVQRLAMQFSPDVVIAGGDTHFGWVGRRIARRLRRAFVFDLFDNYRAFASARFPGVERVLGALIRDADLVVAVSRGLREVVGHDRVIIVPNGVDMNLFHPRQRPSRTGPGRQTVGYVGGVAPQRGIESLVMAVEILRQRGRDLKLVIAGPVAEGFSVPDRPWLEYVGVLEQAQVPELISQLDVAVLPYPASEWAMYTSPYKLLEYMACEVPVVVTDVSEFRSSVPSEDSVCRPSDPIDMARAIDYQIEHRVTMTRKEEWAWEARAAFLADELSRLARGAT